MRVLYLVPTLNSVAPIQVMVNLIHHTPAVEKSVIALFSSAEDNLKSHLKGVECIEYQGVLAWMRDLVFLIRYSKEFDLIHSSGFFPIFLSSILMLFNRRSKYVATVHSNETEEFRARDFPFKARLKHRFRLWLHQIIYRKQDRCVAISGDVHGYLQNIGVSASEVIYNGIDVEHFPSTTPKKRDETIRIVQIGFIENLKNQYCTLEWANDLQQRGLDVEVDFYGAYRGTYKQQLDAYIAKTHLQQIHFWGHVPRKILLGKLGAYDYVFIPSKSEGLSLALLESCYANCIPIVSDKGGMKEVIPYLEAGYVFDLEDDQKFEKIYHFILRTKEQIYHNKEKIQTYFSAHKMGQAYQKCYSELMR